MKFLRKQNLLIDSLKRFTEEIEALEVIEAMKTFIHKNKTQFTQKR